MTARSEPPRLVSVDFERLRGRNRFQWSQAAPGATLWQLLHDLGIGGETVRDMVERGLVELDRPLPGDKRELRAAVQASRRQPGAPLGPWADQCPPPRHIEGEKTERRRAQKREWQRRRREAKRLERATAEAPPEPPRPTKARRAVQTPKARGYQRPDNETKPEKWTRRCLRCRSTFTDRRGLFRCEPCRKVEETPFDTWA